MRPAPIVVAGLLLLLAGIGVWITLADGADPRPPVQPSEPSATRNQPGAPPLVERVPAVRPPDPAAAETTPPAEVPRAEAPEAAANVALRVRSVAAHADVEEFSWRFRHGATTLRGEGRQGRAAMHLPPGGTGQLLVEAPGFAPVTIDVTAPAAERPTTTVDAFLAAAAQATGITLLVHDTARQPIPHVRVDAWPLQPQSDRDAFHLGASLWARRSAAADGRYVLPELPPGEYGIRVLATDEDFLVLPLLPYLRTFTLTGSSGHLEDVTLEPGCLPEFDLYDATGAELDPASVGAVRLQLHLPGGAPVPRLWTQPVLGPSTVVVDALPGRGTVTLAQAVPADTYVLVVTIADQQRVQQFVTLRTGERQRERIVVP